MRNCIWTRKTIYYSINGHLVYKYGYFLGGDFEDNFDYKHLELSRCGQSAVKITWIIRKMLKSCMVSNYISNCSWEKIEFIWLGRGMRVLKQCDRWYLLFAHFTRLFFYICMLVEFHNVMLPECSSNKSHSSIGILPFITNLLPPHRKWEFFQQCYIFYSIFSPFLLLEYFSQVLDK